MATTRPQQSKSGNDRPRATEEPTPEALARSAAGAMDELDGTDLDEGLTGDSNTAGSTVGASPSNSPRSSQGNAPTDTGEPDAQGRPRESDADGSAEKARQAQRAALGLTDEEGDEDPGVLAARKAQQDAYEQQIQAIIGTPFGEEPEEPEGFEPVEVGDEVFYAYDHDGIIEYLPAKVVDTEPWGGGLKLSAPMEKTMAHLAVQVNRQRHNANRSEVLRMNVPYGNGPEQWLAEKPANAERTFMRQLQTRVQRDAIRREEARSTPSDRAVV